MDDSLSAVDARTEAAIIENIRTERSGKTTIITTHRLSAVQHADWILVMDEGAVIEEGTRDQLIQREAGMLSSLKDNKVKVKVRIVG